MTAGSRNHIALQWKSNIRISGQAIYAGAGPIGSQFSPTRLTLSFLPNPPNLTSAVSTTQDKLTGSDGVSWQLVDPSLNVQVTPPANCLAVISGNADLWTADRGYNQDLGIGVTGGSYPSTSNQPEAWKESGGFAGTNSPNAAFVQTVLPLLSQTTYTIGLVWKTNIPAAAASIYVGAGDPRSGQFSPTALHVELICP